MKSEQEILDEWLSKFQRGFLRVIIFRMFHQLYKTDELLTGNEIREKIESKTGGKWKPSPGSVYPILSEMERDGIINEKETGNQKNKEYHLTEFGLHIFEKLIEETLVFRPHHQSKRDIHSKEFREQIENGFAILTVRQLKDEYERHKEIMEYEHERLKIITEIMEEMLKQKILEDPLLD
ncbi:MAG: helix-turn-helix transcriptional regulator [Candidatus Heimdallarchaeota archaeon]|nr:helix-turn-helix transcriptional regulator [Candidatus Heimdallarchaeota archaeon]